MRSRIFLLSLLCCFCLISQVEATTTVKWYVDPDASGGGTGVDWTNAYTSLSAFEAAEGKDISTGSGSDEIFVVNCRSSAGGDDTTTFRFDGFTVDATAYLIITGDAADGGDFPTDGIWDETKYIHHNNDSVGTSIECREDYIHWDKIQFKVTETSTNIRNGLVFNVITAVNNDVRISNCIFKGICSGTGAAYGLYPTDTDLIIKIWNTIITGFFISADTDFRGIELMCSTADTDNCTVYNCTRGINRSGGTVNLINCAIFNNDDDVAGTFNSITYSALDDAQAGTGNIQISQSADDWAALVVDAAGDDFHVTDASSELYNTGNGATPKALFTDDIIGTTRGPADLDWDIGAFELEAPAPSGGQIIMITSLPWILSIPLLYGIVYLRTKYKEAA